MIESYRNLVPKIDAAAWVHGDATVIGEVQLASGVSIWPRVVLRGDQGLISIGQDSNIQDGAISHDTGAHSETHIGPRTTVGHGAILHGCRVEGESIIGMGSILLDNCVIGRNCIIGAGALIAPGKVIPPNSLVMGSPGRVVRAITEKDQAWIEHSWRVYKDLAAEYKAKLAGGDE
jgi:carbonic anhydrase/acetyltransferase-like protein (isoleucine patch superfamily)